MMFLLSWIVQVTIILLVTIMALPLFRKGLQQAVISCFRPRLSFRC